MLAVTVLGNAARAALATRTAVKTRCILELLQPGDKVIELGLGEGPGDDEGHAIELDQRCIDDIVDGDYIRDDATSGCARKATG